MNTRAFPALVIAALSCLAFAQALPEIYRPDPKEKDPWADVALRIESLTCGAQSLCTVRARGFYRGEPVGLEVVVGAVNGGRRGISYRSIGEESNRFLRALAELYKVRGGVPEMKTSTFADAVVLGGNLNTMQSQRIDIKVFFYADGPESKYAELYTNVDPVRGILQVHEKDPDYRENVIKALGK